MVKVKKEDVDAMCAKWEVPIKVNEVDGEKKEEEKLGDEEKKDEHHHAVFATTATTAPQLKTRIVKNEKKSATPSKEWTGVDESVTEICATLSQQIYHAKSKDYFKFDADESDETEVIIFDDHGDLDPALPAFAAVATQDTIILGWRGSSRVLDWVTDFAMAPVVSSELGKAATGIRSHGMFCALVGSDLQVHQDPIVSFIKKHRITKIIFTGHSLGGGLAYIAHLFVQAQISGNNNNSVWNGLGRVTCNTVAFAAPMATFDLDEVENENELAKKLFEEVGKHTCNFVFGCDVVPRGYAHTNYVYEVAEVAAPEAIRERNPVWFGLGSSWVSEAVLNFLRDTSAPLVPVAAKFRHIGDLLYYSSPDNKEILEDVGPVSSDDKKHLSHYTYKSYGVKKGEHVQTLVDTHMHFPKALAPYISVEEE